MNTNRETVTPQTEAPSGAGEGATLQGPRQHCWKSTGLDTHKGEYWYQCEVCGKSDWIASYGTMDQLMPAVCPGPPGSARPAA